MGFILLAVIAIIAAVIGSSKGYSGVGCFFAGLIGGVITIIVLLFLPNKIEQEKALEAERYRARVLEKKMSEMQRQSSEVEALKKRIRELEEAKNNSAAASEESE